MKLFATLAFLVAYCKAAPPTFAQDYYSGVYNSLALNQGGINTADGACCEPTASQCKVQTIAEGSDTYVEYSHNRSRTDSPQGIVANLYLEKKQVALQPDDNGGYVCAQYCPLDEVMEPLEIKKTALNEGRHMITQGGEGGKTKEVQLWYFTDRIIIVPLDHQFFYVDTSVDPPAPFYVSDHISPLNKPIAVENTSYLQYTPGAHPSKFNISGLDNCPKSQNCGNNNGIGLQRIWNKFTDTVMQRARKIVAKTPSSKIAELTSAKQVRSGDIPTFPGDYVAKEDSLLLINQGGEEDANGNFCCAKTHLGQCQIQLQSLDGMHFVDYSNNRTRFEDVHNGITVNDYKAHKSYDIVHNETLSKDVCVKFCPLDPEETLDNLFVDPDAKDKGQTTLNGKTVEKWQWSEVILKIIRMSTTDFYADQSNASMAIPVFQTERITPFGGAQIGSENHTWTDLKAQPIDPAKFDIAGLDDCPEDPQCQQPGWQHKRIFFRQRATWAKYAVSSRE